MNGCDLISGLLKDEAYCKLVMMIYDGKFVPDQIYSLNMTADLLQMSRTPVRDAIQRLSNEGKIDLLPSRGFCLHRLSETEFLNRIHLSNSVEGYCAYSLAKKRKNGVTSADILTLQDLVHKMESLDLETVSFGEFTRLDNAFHQALIDSVQEAHFGELFEKQAGLINSPELHPIKTPQWFRIILSHHQRIFKAIWDGDCIGAYEALISHAESVYSNYKKARKD